MPAVAEDTRGRGSAEQEAAAQDLPSSPEAEEMSAQEPAYDPVQYLGVDPSKLSFNLLKKKLAAAGWDHAAIFKCKSKTALLELVQLGPPHKAADDAHDQQAENSKKPPTAEKTAPGASDKGTQEGDAAKQSAAVSSMDQKIARVQKLSEKIDPKHAAWKEMIEQKQQWHARLEAAEKDPTTLPAVVEEIRRRRELLSSANSVDQEVLESALVTCVLTTAPVCWQRAGSAPRRVTSALQMGSDPEAEAHRSELEGAERQKGRE